MLIDNHTIANHFSLLSRLMDIHGENSFKAKSYANAAFTIEKLPFELKDTPSEKIFQLKGIGEAIGNKIQEILQTGRLSLLESFLAKTPPGIIEMLQIKGLGPKKIATIWKELEIETLGELLYACNENRLLLYKGFGQKTQDSIRQAIEFYLANRQKHLYAQIETAAIELEAALQATFSPAPVTVTGAFRRGLEIIDEIEFVIATTTKQIQQKLPPTFELEAVVNDQLAYSTPEKLKIKIYSCPPGQFAWTLFTTTGSDPFIKEFLRYLNRKDLSMAPSETAIFQSAGMDFIDPALRENGAVLQQAQQHCLPQLIETPDIRSVIHAHSNWSDGLHSLEKMAQACKTKGFEYLVISDHSQSAFYANGLSADRIKAQHQLIDELNTQLAPFKIFKSIEADILNDGNLDYSDALLSTFDLVIASVHANLKMSEEKAMQRLMRAIENPYTTILGHMTGRLLLSRNGYPINHQKIIDVCVAHQVVIELNAHPSRLDIDWRWISYALNKGALLSINPDAHAIEGFEDVRYGVMVARKGGLTKEQNLSSYDLRTFENFLAQRKNIKGI